MQKGSALILVMIAVMIMSTIVMGLLNVGTTEIRTPQDQLLKKKAFYHALLGLEVVIDQARFLEDPSQVPTAKVTTSIEADRTIKSYYIGNMATGEEKISHLSELQAPSPVGISLSYKSDFFTAMYRVPMVAEVATANGKSTTFSEIEAGILVLLKN